MQEMPRENNQPQTREQDVLLFFQMNLGHGPERPSLAKVASEAYVLLRKRDRRVCGGQCPRRPATFPPRPPARRGQSGAPAPRAARPGAAQSAALPARACPEPPPPCFPYSRWPAPPGPARAGPSRHGVWLGGGQCPDDVRLRPTARPALPPARLAAAPATADAAQTPQLTTSLPPAARQPGARRARDAAARAPREACAGCPDAGTRAEAASLASSSSG